MICPRSLSENSVVGPRASVFSPGKEGEAGDVGFIVDTRVQAGGKQAARSQIEFSDRLLPPDEPGLLIHGPAQKLAQALQVIRIQIVYTDLL
jgi:hypothetical protein